MTAVLEVRHATKSFPGVKALDDVTLEIRKNEVVGLIGENGAGKSTLLKVLNGVYAVEDGEIRVNGRATPIAGPRDAFDHGIAMVFQEQSILTTLSVAENIFLGRENEFLRWGVLDKAAMNAAAAVELEKVHLDVDPATSCADLTFAERQMVEIAKAISLDTRVEGDIVILLDEPTSVLESKEIEVLFRIVRELRDRAAFVFISHRIEEVLGVSDRVYVMRDGKVVAETSASEVSIDRLHELMVGRALHHEYYREARQGEPGAEIAMAARDLTSRTGFRNVSFTLRKGEILGIAGVIGSGREALARCLAGLARIDSGTLEIGGEVRRFRGPSEAVAAGVGYLPRERRIEGVVTGVPVIENMTMSALDEFTAAGLIQRGRERTVAREWIDKLSIKTPSPDTFRGLPVRRQPAEGRAVEVAHRGLRHRRPRSSDAGNRRRREGGRLRAHPRHDRRGDLHPSARRHPGRGDRPQPHDHRDARRRGIRALRRPARRKAEPGRAHQAHGLNRMNESTSTPLVAGPACRVAPRRDMQA